MSNYSIKDLKVLSPQEHVRQRKLMYIGDSQNPAPLFNEIFDNALDESQAGFSDKTDVIINYDLNQITITDYGRGFPQGKLKDTQRDKDVEALELLCTTAFSGGKFSNINYRISSGLHGVGLLVTNSLSSEFKIETWRKNNRVTYIGKQGETVSCKVSKTTRVTNSGTTVTFVPDKTMFSDIQIPLSHIKMRCHVAEAFGMKCSLTVIRSGVEEVIDTTSDIYDLLPEDESSISEYYRHTFTVKDEETGEFATIALKYTSDTKSYYRGYTNLLYNSNGGSHHKMLDSAIQEAWSKIKVDDIKPNDVFLGLRGVVAVFISDAEFSSQSKERLAVNKDKLETLRELIVKEIYKWLKKNDEVRESLIKRFQEYRASQNKLLARKEIKSLLVVNTSKEGSIKRGTNIRKLRECDSKKRDGTELFIVEGDSAVGSAVKARDVHLQSILPVKGKVLNVARCSDIKEALTNEETRDIVNAIGAGIGDDSDSSKSRYEKIIFMCFTGDTKVKCLDGNSYSFEELVSSNTKSLWVYSRDKDGKIVPALATNPRITGYTSEILELQLDSGDVIKCTKDHLFLLKDGTYKKAEDLTVYDSLSPLYLSSGGWSGEYLTYYDDTCSRWEIVHGLVNKYINGLPDEDFMNYLNETGQSLITHHKDLNKYNNTPENLVYLGNKDHVKEHNNLTKYNKSEEHKELVKEMHKQGRFKTWAETYNGSEKHLEAIRRTVLEGRNSGKRVITEYNKSDKHRQLTSSMNKDGQQIIRQQRGKLCKIGKYLIENGYVLTESLFKDRSPIEGLGKKPTLKYILSYFDDFDTYVEACKNYNHKIVSKSLKVLEEPIPVYDLTVEDHHNFALESGVFVHNCDADADGKEICVLLSGMFVNLLPNLVKDGLIYVALPPLYGWESKFGKKGYCNLLSDVPKDYKVLTRYKGLGQMDPDELWESVMNPKTRRLLKLEYPDDIKSFNSILTSSAVKFKMLEDKGLIKYEV